MSYKGEWGYHPLVVSLFNTGEPLYLVNRSGNRPSHDMADPYANGAIELCRRGGFKKVLLRGDTDFTQTAHLDGWDEQQVGFIFGIDAMPNLKDFADNLPKTAWKPLIRRPKREVNTQPRRRPENVKERIVVEREYENIRLQGEHVAEFPYRPTACKKSYRIVVVRKDLSVERGEEWLFDDLRYFFYLTNDKTRSVDEIVELANGRCNQENLIEQLKNGVRALDMPVDNLLSNWAYMVMASLAWTLKAWFALSLPESGRWAAKHVAEKRSLCEAGGGSCTGYCRGTRGRRCSSAALTRCSRAGSPAAKVSEPRTVRYDADRSLDAGIRMSRPAATAKRRTEVTMNDTKLRLSHSARPAGTQLPRLSDQPPTSRSARGGIRLIWD